MQRLNVDKLEIGDIVLEGYFADSVSEAIREATNSDYSHAKLFWGESMLHSDVIVITENPSRVILEDCDKACALRIKNVPNRDMIIQNAISYARSLVGTLYDKRGLVLLNRGERTTSDNNRQMCARLIAESFQYAGLSLVEDYLNCSPGDLFRSTNIDVIEDILLDAPNDYVSWAKSNNSVADQRVTLIQLFEDVRKASKEDLVTIEQINNYLSLHKEFDQEFSVILQNSGYLNLWEKEYIYNPSHYDAKLFEEVNGANTSMEANRVIQSSYLVINHHKCMIRYYDYMINTHGDLLYFKLMKEMHENVRRQANERICELSILTI